MNNIELISQLSALSNQNKVYIVIPDGIENGVQQYKHYLIEHVEEYPVDDTLITLIFSGV